MERIYCSEILTPMGFWHVCATDRGVCAVRPGKRSGDGENRMSRQGAQELLAYFAGGRTSFSVPLDLQGTKFQRKVWLELRSIPYGQTVTYADVAKSIGKPGAARAVGQAVGRNPCLVMVPCHRVLGKNGTLTGFSAGMELKKQLLGLEGIKVHDG